GPGACRRLVPSVSSCGLVAGKRARLTSPREGSNFRAGCPVMPSVRPACNVRSMRPCPSALRAAGLLWGFFACAAARASPSGCEAPGFRSFGAIELVEHDRSALAGIPASSRLETRDFALGFAHRSGRFAWGITHRYAIFDFAGIEPQTNGHVHTTTLPLHWRSSGNRLRFSAAPALSASSNVMGHPQEWQSETLRSEERRVG